MFGAIIGDICGSVYEFHNLKTDEPEAIDLIRPDCRFTDDSVMTLAVADACLNGLDYALCLRDWGRRYSKAGYGSHFFRWLFSSSPAPYNSWGNGSAMRVSPVGWIFDNVPDVRQAARRTAEVTHNHPEGVRGAEAVAVAVYMARTGASKVDIRNGIETLFGYDLSRTIEEIRPTYSYDMSCQGTVPESITAFLESRDFKHALQLAVSLGGDTDTIACIVGGIAEAYYREIPQELGAFAWERLEQPMRDVVTLFHSGYYVGKLNRQ